MERRKHVTPEEVRKAVQRLIARHGSRPIPLEAIGGSWLLEALEARDEDDDVELEVTQVEPLEDEIDLEAVVSELLEPSLIEVVGSQTDSGSNISSWGGLSGDSSGIGSRDRGARSRDGDASASSGRTPRGDAGASESSAPESAGSAPGGIEPGPALNPELAPPDNVVPSTWGRYKVLGQLARGGQGRILHATDDIVGRPIALKVLQRKGLSDPRQVRKFYDEAQITGQLEHPFIIPVHELGRLENGLPYYTMKKIEGRTLKKIVIGLRKKNPLIQMQYGRVRLITILQQVCQAVSYAHDRGVIHRDLKPSNIMLGSYGEVIVLDWGVARLLSPEGRHEAKKPGVVPVKLIRKGTPQDTLTGAIEGTPAYMAPEQARGRNNEIDERTDVYALGAILYELLTYRPPFRGDVNDVLRRVPIELPVRPSVFAPHNQIPEELELICMKCLSKSKGERYASVKDLEKELDAFLEGTKRRAAAAKKVEEANELVKQHQQLQRELLMARVVARRAGEGIEGWEPIERKRGVWATWDRVEEFETRIRTTFGEAISRLSQALAHEPENREARERLAELFVSQYRKAERQGEHSEALYCESMVRQYQMGGFEAFLKGEGTLSLTSDPPGVEVWFYRYEERDRILRPVDARLLGRTPIQDVALPQGSYLVVLRASGFRDVYYPVKLGRQETWKGSVTLYRHEQIGDGFIYIPAGPTLLGGDREAIDSFDKERKELGDFAIHEFPVTFREYIEFLNAWLSADPAEAEQLEPRLDEGMPLVTLESKGYVPIQDLIGPESKTSIGRPGMEYDVPVFGVDFEHAEAFCAWRSEVTGQDLRLATEDEWEKAARGVDGRVFPWGNQFDPTFCKSRLSRPWAPEPEPIRSFPEDISPYGVREMAGGVREWCDSWYNEPQGLRVLRGGAWVDTERYMRCASRSFYEPSLTRRVAGFRCVRSLA